MPLFPSPTSEEPDYDEFSLSHFYIAHTNNVAMGGGGGGEIRYKIRFSKDFHNYCSVQYSVNVQN